MIAWFLIAIATVAFFAYIAITGVTTVDTVGTTAGRADTIRRIDAVVASLSERAATIQGDGVTYAPAGVPGSGEYLLPSDMQANAITSFGARFQYCPMGAELDSANGTVQYPGGSYEIRTAELNGRRYVVTGRVPGGAGTDPNVIGFVIAPVNAMGAFPGCGQIVRNGENYSAPNGIVRVIRRSQSAESDLVRTSGGTTWYVTPNGGGTGASWSSPATITQAVAAYRDFPGGSFIIRMSEGSHRLAGGLLDQTLTGMVAKKDGSSLALVGSQGASLSTSAISVPSDLDVTGLYVADSAIVATSGHALNVTDSATGSLVVNGGAKLSIKGTSSIYGSPGVVASIQVAGGSTATIVNNPTIYVQPSYRALYVTGSSKAAIIESNLSLQPVGGNATRNDLLRIDTGSSLSLRSSTVNFNTPSSYAIFTGGTLIASSTALNYNASTTSVGVQTLPGADVSLLGIEMQGSRVPDWSIASQNASRFIGNGNLRATNRCWYQGQYSLHRYSTPGIAGANSNVSAQETWARLNDPVTPQQVTDYQTMQQRNVERLDVRPRIEGFSGTFTCQQSAGPSYITCAGENGYCALPNDGQPRMVRYGLNNSWVYMVTGRGITCDNATFTDPLVGTVKICQYTS